jgi:hypothetical protein
VIGTVLPIDYEEENSTYSLETRVRLASFGRRSENWYVELELALLRQLKLKSCSLRF